MSAIPPLLGGKETLGELPENDVMVDRAKCEGMAQTATADKLKAWARTLKRDVHALYLASRDPRVPWYAKALALIVAGYALSPIDLIPDFIPVLGYLDDVIVVPAGVWLVIQLVPADVMAEHRALADAARSRPVSKAGAIAIIAIWIAAAALFGWLLDSYLFQTRD